MQVTNREAQWGCLCSGITFIMHNSSSTAEGCYSLHDKVKRVRMRSGKYTGRPIQERLNEHVKHAKPIRDTKFYRSYPSGEIGHKEKHEWRDGHIRLRMLPIIGQHFFIRRFVGN